MDIRRIREERRADCVRIEGRHVFLTLRKAYPRFRLLIYKKEALFEESTFALFPAAEQWPNYRVAPYLRKSAATWHHTQEKQQHRLE